MKTELSPEKKLWLSVINAHVDSAMGCFSLYRVTKSGETMPLESQKKELLKKYNDILCFETWAKNEKEKIAKNIKVLIKRIRNQKDVKENKKQIYYLFSDRLTTTLKKRHKNKLRLLLDRENYQKCSLEAGKSRHFLETSNFDDTVFACGYDTFFIRKTFEYVQKAITLEKELFEEVSSKAQKQLEGIQKNHSSYAKITQLKFFTCFLIVLTITL